MTSVKYLDSKIDYEALCLNQLGNNTLVFDKEHNKFLILEPKTIPKNCESSLNIVARHVQELLQYGVFTDLPLAHSLPMLDNLKILAENIKSHNSEAELPSWCLPIACCCKAEIPQFPIEAIQKFEQNVGLGPNFKVEQLSRLLSYLESNIKEVEHRTFLVSNVMKASFKNLTFLTKGDIENWLIIADVFYRVKFFEQYDIESELQEQFLDATIQVLGSSERLKDNVAKIAFCLFQKRSAMLMTGLQTPHITAIANLHSRMELSESQETLLATNEFCVHVFEKLSMGLVKNEGKHTRDLVDALAGSLDALFLQKQFSIYFDPEDHKAIVDLQSRVHFISVTVFEYACESPIVYMTERYLQALDFAMPDKFMICESLKNLFRALNRYPELPQNLKSLVFRNKLLMNNLYDYMKSNPEFYTQNFFKELDRMFNPPVVVLR